MEILTDLHTHTIACAHAYSTVNEIAKAAARSGLEAVAITDHGIDMGDSPHEWHFINLRVIPEYIEGVRILRGCEANIMDLSGKLDMRSEVLAPLDIVIASIHNPTYYEPSPDGDYTSAYMGALENPDVNIIGHSGSPQFMYDYRAVIRRAGELNKLIELNASTFKIRPNSVSNCMKIAKICKEEGVGVAVNSDAHHSSMVGNYGDVIKMLGEIDFPEELVINRNYLTLKKYLGLN